MYFQKVIKTGNSNSKSYISKFIRGSAFKYKKVCVGNYMGNNFISMGRARRMAI